MVPCACGDFSWGFFLAVIARRLFQFWGNFLGWLVNLWTLSTVRVSFSPHVLVSALRAASKESVMRNEFWSLCSDRQTDRRVLLSPLSGTCSHCLLKLSVFCAWSTVGRSLCKTATSKWRCARNFFSISLQLAQLRLSFGS